MEYYKMNYDKLKNIPQIKYLRIHSRVPIVIPNRIDDELISILKNSRLRIVLVIHSNHSAELDTFTASKLNELIKINVVIFNQTVLLKGVNDSVQTLTDLSYKLFDLGVMPYYLHVLDKVKGAQHFDLDIDQTHKLYNGVLANLPGYLVPKLVREIAGEANKTPLLTMNSC